MRKKILKIKNIIKKYNLNLKNVDLYGDYKAKIDYAKIKGENGKLILVTAINPTKFGEGKTTVSIGLTDAMNKLGKKTVVALREPSLGPVFGIKGGATGGGEAQILPSDDINLHFTGDFHAITSANNLICSMIDNNLYFDNPLKLKSDTICFHRCLDLNDRALRNIELNIEGKIYRKEKFNITAASEIMAIMGLTENIQDLKKMIGNILIGFNDKNKPVYVKNLNCVDAVVALLKDALKPNVVQTADGNLTLVHLGPFANISYGCNSLNATKTALKIGDYAVTEAGFGADLGAEKFLDLICPKGNFAPDCVVLVATIRALKLNGGVDENLVDKPNIESIKNGLKILFKHYKNLTQIYGLKVVIAVNRFPSDTDEELDFLINELDKKNIKSSVCEPYNKGGDGCVGLAKKVVDEIENANEKKYKPCYSYEDKFEIKLEKIIKNLYGANETILSEKAEEKLKLIKKFGYDKLPIVVAKTQYSLSDDSKKIGVTEGFNFTITDFEIQSGAGYIIALAGKTILMPGLNKTPNATKIKINKNKIIF